MWKITWFGTGGLMFLDGSCCEPDYLLSISTLSGLWGLLRIAQVPLTSLWNHGRVRKYGLMMPDL